MDDELLYRKYRSSTLFSIFSNVFVRENYICRVNKGKKKAITEAFFSPFVSKLCDECGNYFVLESSLKPRYLYIFISLRNSNPYFATALITWK